MGKNVWYRHKNIILGHIRENINYFNGLLRGRDREGVIKTKMRVKLAAKMLRIAWALMKKKQVLNPDYLFIK